MLAVPPKVYTLLDIINLRNRVVNICYTEYCNVLVDEIYKILHGDDVIEEIPLVEEYSGNHNNYIRYVLDQIQEELTTNGIAFIELANSSGEERTFIHRFILFNTTSGVVRLESYGKTLFHESLTGKGFSKTEHSLYKPRIVEWQTWSNDITTLLNLNSGEARLYYWNGLFSAMEEQDIAENIDVILLK